jgi:hypothetical protein
MNERGEAEARARPRERGEAEERSSRSRAIAGGRALAESEIMNGPEDER